MPSQNNAPSENTGELAEIKNAEKLSLNDAMETFREREDALKKNSGQELAASSKPAEALDKINNSKPSLLPVIEPDMSLTPAPSKPEEPKDKV